MWEGDWTVKMTTIITFFMLIASRALAIIHPIILRKIIFLISCVYSVEGIDAPSCGTPHEVYIYIVIYAFVKMGSELVNYLRELPFSVTVANAEKYIAGKVYNHIQR